MISLESSDLPAEDSLLAVVLFFALLCFVLSE
jgi:hypothetical protein